MTLSGLQRRPLRRGVNDERQAQRSGVLGPLGGGAARPLTGSGMAGRRARRRVRSTQLGVAVTL